MLTNKIPVTINCKGRLISLEKPKVMGILNVTPDSFFDGGRYMDDQSLVERVGQMLAEGADFIDIGGYSSRPGAENISVAQETERVQRSIELVMSNFPDAIVSIDTFRSEVAKYAVGSGAAIVNDISAGLLDDRMLHTVASLGVPYIMMHMRGNPATMQTMTTYDDIVKDMLIYFSKQIAGARALGISDIIIDPGFGFAKTLDQNFQVLAALKDFAIAGLPILAGVSRKSMIYKPLGADADSALNGTTAVNMALLLKGASILRVHDVVQARQCVRLFNHITDGGKVRCEGS